MRPEDSRACHLLEIPAIVRFMSQTVVGDNDVETCIRFDLKFCKDKL